MNGWNIKRLMGALKHRRIKSWQLAVLLLIAVASSLFFLRQNNLNMVRLRNEVIAADEAGQGVAAALETLNRHVFQHMNTAIVRPIELVNTYNRQAEAVIRQTVVIPNRDLYAEAAQACASQGSLFSATRTQCVTNYIEGNSAGFGDLPKINLPDKSRFIYNFASPRWTPDLAGFSLLAAALLLIWILARMFEKILVSIIIRRRHRNGF